MDEKQKLYLFIATAVVVCTYLVLSVEPTPRKSHGDVWKLERQARVAIEKQLLTPSTAKYDLAVYKTSDGERFVKGYVDSQNAFGAMIRRQVIVRFTPSVEVLFL